MANFLDKITPDGIKTINDGVQSLLDPINPFVSDLNDEIKAIAQHLLSEGITPEQIKNFVDVSRAQLDPWLDQEAEVQKRVNEAVSKMKKAPAKRSTKAA